jgi:hypothetical protein
MTGTDAEAVEAVKLARRRVGFDMPAKTPVKKTGGLSPGLRRAIEDGVRGGNAQFAAKVAAAAARPTASVGGTPREEMHRPGVEGGELHKSSKWDHVTVTADRRAHDAGVRAGDAIVRAAQARRAVPAPAGAIADATTRRDELRALYKVNGWQPDGRLRDAEALVETLSAPVLKVNFAPSGRVEDAQLEENRARLDALAVEPGVDAALRTAPYVQSPKPQEAQPWQPHAGDVMASEAAAARMGCEPTEYAAAWAEAQAGAPAWLERLTNASVANAIKRAPRLRGLATRPPRVTP